MAEDAMRLDRFLWFIRVVKKREWAQAMASEGHLRIDGRAVDKASACVRVGQVLTFATQAGRVRALRVAALPGRRGPPEEAKRCYDELLRDVPAPGSMPAAANVSHHRSRD